MVKIGINGFGAVGRLVLRVCLERILNRCAVKPPVNVVAVNDASIQNASHMAYLFKYHSTHGVYPGEITTMGNCMVIDGQRVECTHETEPAKIPWAKNCTEYVIESSRTFTDCASAGTHAARRIIITADSPDAPIFVMGVNHDCYQNEMKVVASGSNTVNALAPLVKVVHENFIIEQCFGVVVHSVMSCNYILDSPTKDMRLGRSGMANIIPTNTTSGEAIEKVYPQLKGKIGLRMLRVPVCDVSLISMTAVLGKEASEEKFKCQVKSAANSYLKGVFGYTEEELVSSDFIGDNRSCIFDVKASSYMNKCFVNCIAWFDDEYGYACRIVDLANYMASREDCN